MWVPVVFTPFLNRVSERVAAGAASKVMVYPPVVNVVLVGTNFFLRQCVVVCVLTALEAENLHG